MSILKRSGISILANITKAGLTFVTGMLIARGLGPEQYGIFAFLLASFTALRSLLDMGTSNAFFTFISKKNRTKIFFSYYVVWLIIQFCVSLLFIGLLAPNEWIEAIWLGESRQLVLVAFIAVFLQQQVWNMIAQVGESQRLTIRVQVLNVSIASLHFLLVVILFLTANLSIENVYYIIIVEFLLAVVVAYLTYPIKFSAGRDKLTNVSHEYWIYCLPLVPYTLLGMMRELADRWLLQYFGGAIEQAYFSVAVQFSYLSMVATASVLRILWKEIAEANAKGEKENLDLLHSRTNRLLFMLAVLVSCFFVPWSTEIIKVLLGDEYLGGAFTMSLMFLFPPFLALSQVNSTFFYALELIKPFVIITTIQHVIVMITTYLFLAPADAIVPGLGLASTGLALSMLLTGFLNVNFSVWFLSRKMGWSFRIGYQFVGMGLFLLIGMVVYYAINMVFDESIWVVIRGVMAGILYTGIGGMILYKMPRLLGLDRDELDLHIGRIKNFTIKT